MADEPEGTQPEGSGDENESKFWEKMGSLIDERVDSGIQRAVDKFRVTGSSRNGGRTSLPDIVANAFFGKPKDPAK